MSILVVSVLELKHTIRKHDIDSDILKNIDEHPKGKLLGPSFSRHLSTILSESDQEQVEYGQHGSPLAR